MFSFFTNFQLDIVLKAHNGYRLLIDVIRKRKLTLECSNRVLATIWYAKHILVKIALHFLILRVTSHLFFLMYSLFFVWKVWLWIDGHLLGYIVSWFRLFCLQILIGFRKCQVQIFCSLCDYYHMIIWPYCEIQKQIIDYSWNDRSLYLSRISFLFCFCWIRKLLWQCTGFESFDGLNNQIQPICQNRKSAF